MGRLRAGMSGGSPPFFKGMVMHWTSIHVLKSGQFLLNQAHFYPCMARYNFIGLSIRCSGRILVTQGVHFFQCVSQHRHSL